MYFLPIFKKFEYKVFFSQSMFLILKGVYLLTQGLTSYLKNIVLHFFLKNMFEKLEVY
jgi:hypothetical protein